MIIYTAFGKMDEKNFGIFFCKFRWMFVFKDWNDALVGDKPHDAFVQYAMAWLSPPKHSPPRGCHYAEFYGLRWHDMDIGRRYHKICEYCGLSLMMGAWPQFANCLGTSYLFPHHFLSPGMEFRVILEDLPATPLHFAQIRCAVCRNS